MNLAERVLSGRSASCSMSFMIHPALGRCAGPSTCLEFPACRASHRHPAAVAAASKPSRPPGKTSQAQGTKGHSGGSAKGARGKPTSQPTAQRAKARTRPGGNSNSSGGAHTNAPSKGAGAPKQTRSAAPQPLPSAAPSSRRTSAAPFLPSTTATTPATATAALLATGVAAVEAAAPAAAAGAVQGAALRIGCSSAFNGPGEGVVSEAKAAGPSAMVSGQGDRSSAGSAEAVTRAGGGAPGAAAASVQDAGAERGNDGDGDDTEDDGFLSLDDGSGGGEERVSFSYEEAGEAGVGAGEGEEDEEDGDGDEDAFPEIRLNLPPPTKVKVKTAEYLQSCVSVSQCPVPRYPEFAVIGRSNVGKSSLINMLTGRKDLAQVSKEPGKTKCINHFIINQSWYFVDLPGYGFAKVGLKGRQQFEYFTREYFKTRPNLAMVFLLVDASIPPQTIDLDYANWLTDNEVPFTVIFTKADKRRKGLTSAVRDSHVTAFKRELLRDLAYLPPSIMTSAAKGLGRGELLSFIAGLRVAYEKSGRLEAIRQGVL